jgi:drug/metabolite transporter (DMT)-like permease
MMTNQRDLSADTRYTSAMTFGILAIVIWGGTPIATKVAVGELSAVGVTFWRTVLAAILALLIVAVRRTPRPAAGRTLGFLLVSALAAYIAFPWLLALGLQRTTAGHAALLVALAPIFTGLLAMAVGRLRVRRLWFAGVALAFGGTAGLVGGAHALGVQGASLAGDLLVLMSAAAAALGYLSGAEAAREIGSLAVTLWGHLAAAVLMLTVAPWAGDALLTGAAPSVATLTAVGYLAAFASLGAYVAWYRALAVSPGISQVQFLQAAVGAVLAALLLGERLGPADLGAAALILLGVFVTQKAIRRDPDRSTA